MNNIIKPWKKYGFEFLSIFVAVISAFSLNNWNQNRNNAIAENKILDEIHQGLDKDIIDIESNMLGHKMGLNAIKYFKKIVLNEKVPQDSLKQYYITLTRDFICIQNTSGFETLKSRGLELIQNDTLRTKIISLYEYDYKSIEKIEEDYYENQFQENYFKDINQILSRNFIFDDKKNIIGISTPLKMDNNEEKLLLSMLWKIEFNRNFTLQMYKDTKDKIKLLIKDLKELKKES
jgi:hypothetical protein